MAISIGGNPPPPPISPLTDHPDDGCTRRWNYHRLTLWHLFVPVVVALLYMGVVDGGLKPNVAHQEAEAKRSYRAKEPLSLPLHDLLLNWAEVECGTTIPPSVHTTCKHQFHHHPREHTFQRRRELGIPRLSRQKW